MASLRDLKRRIVSVKKTRQITSAMKMVAAAKMQKAIDRAIAAKPYKESLVRVLGRVADRVGGDVEHPMLTQHESAEKILVVVFGTDKGLCGSFNTLLFREVVKFTRRQREAGRDVTLRAYGRKAAPFFRARKISVETALTDLHPKEYMDYVIEMAEVLTVEFHRGDYQEVYLAFNTFKTVMNQPATIAQILPLSVEGSDAAEDTSEASEYTYEPDAGEVLNTLLPLYLQTTLYQGLLETEAGEHASRMTAMESATKNASELIDELTLKYNRARQAAITTEIIEIVSGAEAL